MRIGLIQAKAYVHERITGLQYARQAIRAVRLQVVPHGALVLDIVLNVPVQSVLDGRFVTGVPAPAEVWIVGEPLSRSDLETLIIVSVGLDARVVVASGKLHAESRVRLILDIGLHAVHQRIADIGVEAGRGAQTRIEYQRL